MLVEKRYAVRRWVLVAAVLTVGVATTQLAAAAPAQAATQEVYRTHPCYEPFSGEINCYYRDRYITLVKYYDSAGRYRVCISNYYHTRETLLIYGWVAGVVWHNNAGEVVHATWNPEAIRLPASNTTNRSAWRAYHAYPSVEYWAYDNTHWHWNTNYPI